MLIETVTTAKPGGHLLVRCLDQAETMARNEPVKAAAAVIGAGVVLNILPLRFLVAGATAATLVMLRPALLALGVVKAFELCTSHSRRHHE